jgi:hypothetical protein
MHTPTQKQWQTVLDKLYSILPFTFENNYHLDMMEPQVNGYGHVCGTVHCVGGWYAIAHYQDIAFEVDESFGYKDGANEMGKDLGFDGRGELMLWCDQHRVLWGNEYGVDLFANPQSYNHGNGPAKSITDVIHHFEFVKHNCLMAERG